MSDPLLSQARATARQLREDWRKHRQLCRECSWLTPGRRRYCQAGWAIVTATRVADKRIADLQDIAGEQLQLDL